MERETIVIWMKGCTDKTCASNHSNTLSLCDEITVITTIQKNVAQFYWSSHIGGKNRQCVKWNNLSISEDKGGLGFRKVQDVSMPLFCKMWWNFRTKNSIWSRYILNKYYKNNTEMKLCGKL